MYTNYRIPGNDSVIDNNYYINRSWTVKLQLKSTDIIKQYQRSQPKLQAGTQGVGEFLM